MQTWQPDTFHNAGEEPRKLRGNREPLRPSRASGRARRPHPKCSKIPSVSQCEFTLSLSPSHHSLQECPCWSHPARSKLPSLTLWTGISPNPLCQSRTFALIKRRLFDAWGQQQTPLCGPGLTWVTFIPLPTTGVRINPRSNCRALKSARPTSLVAPSPQRRCQLRVTKEKPLASNYISAGFPSLMRIANSRGTAARLKE